MGPCHPFVYTQLCLRIRIRTRFLGCRHPSVHLRTTTLATCHPPIPPLLHFLSFLHCQLSNKVTQKNAPKNPNKISLYRTDHRETGKNNNVLVVLCRRGAFYQTNVLIRLNDNKVFLGHLGPPEGLGPPEHCQLCFVSNPAFV